MSFYLYVYTIARTKNYNSVPLRGGSGKVVRRKRVERGVATLWNTMAEMVDRHRNTEIMPLIKQIVHCVVLAVVI